MATRRNAQGEHFTRRRFFQVSAGIGFGVYTSATGGKIVAQESTPIGSPVGTPVQVSTPPATTVDPATLKEAPMLAEQVATGALPPVAERIGSSPLVIAPHESIGQYGGTWRTALVGGGDLAWLDRTIAYEGLVRWNPEWTEVIPNVCESYEASADVRSFTFTLRAGMKWSDGAPYTTRDIEFNHVDVYRNSDLTTSLGVNPYTIEIVDERTFIVTLERPDGLYLRNLCNPGSLGVGLPAHYLEQFHKSYNTTNLDQLVAENGAADWIELFQGKGTSIPGTPLNALWQNAELPRLHGWVVTSPYGDTERVVVSRNPYYFKIDPEGNQLPYIDSVNYDVMQDNEVLLLKAAAGELDMHARHINTDTNKPVLAEAQEAGQFHFFETIQGPMNTCMLPLNLCHKNPALREVFQNKDFRIALSHAINRQEIIDTVYVSQGEPWQSSPRRETPYYNETLAKQYTEYDIDLANQMLDAILPDKDGDGIRLMSNGQRVTFVIEVAASGTAVLTDPVNLVVGYWRAVGIDCQIDPIDRALHSSRKAANDQDCSAWVGDGGLNDALQELDWYFPSNASDSNYAIPWAIWYLNPSNPQAEAEEPPPAAREQMDLFGQLQATGDEAEQNAIFARILEITQQEFYAIGVSLPGPGYGIVKNNFRNVPAVMPGSYLYPTPAPTRPEQYYFDQTGA